jgi:hypothetical protein
LCILLEGTYSVCGQNMLRMRSTINDFLAFVS